MDMLFISFHTSFQKFNTNDSQCFPQRVVPWCSPIQSLSCLQHRLNIVDKTSYTTDTYTPTPLIFNIVGNTV